MTMFNRRSNNNNHKPTTFPYQIVEFERKYKEKADKKKADKKESAGDKRKSGNY